MIHSDTLPSTRQLPKVVSVSAALAYSFIAVAGSIAGSYVQNFDFPDGTTELDDGSTLASINPAGGQGEAQVLDGQLQLTRDEAMFENASFRIPMTTDGAEDGWTAIFDFTISDGAGGSAPGEGFSFSYGAIGPFDPAVPEAANGHGDAEEGWPDTEHISFEFDTAEFPGMADRGLSIAWNQEDFATLNDPVVGDGQTISGRAFIHWDPRNGASFRTTGLLRNADFQDIRIPGFDGADSFIFAFSARTRMPSQSAFIDNLVITTFVDDRDGDGLLDDWERENGLDPSDPIGDHGPNGDPDSDGVLNCDEFNNGTSPTEFDSDGDLYSDFDEARFGTDPTNPDDKPKLTDGLVTFYSFAASSLNDTFTGRAAIPSGPVPPGFTEGSLGMGVQLDGIDQFLSIEGSDGDAFQFGDTGFAISMQVKIDRFDKPNQVILAKGDNLVIRRNASSNSLQLVLDGLPIPREPSGTNAATGEYVYIYALWTPSGGARFSVADEPLILAPAANFTDNNDLITIGASALNPILTATEIGVDSVAIYNAGLDFDLTPGGGQVPTAAPNPASYCHPKGQAIETQIVHDWVTNEVILTYPTEIGQQYMVEASTSFENMNMVKIEKALKDWEIASGPTNTGIFTVQLKSNVFVEAYRVFECDPDEEL